MTQRGATETYHCKNCGDPFTARVADRKRGWARFCSKSCKASKQEQRTGQHSKYLARQNRQELSADPDFDISWDAHQCNAINPRYGDETPD